MLVTLVLRTNIAASAQVSVREYTAMSGPTGWPFGLVFSVSFVSAYLAAHFAAQEFRGVNVRVGVAVQNRLDQLVELVDPIQGRSARR
jgi:hypothetical protein